MYGGEEKPTDSRSMIARNGRDKERRNSRTGARLAAGVVALSTDESHPEEGNEARNKYVLLVSSSNNNKGNQWVLPKGGWENDESIVECALREVWEEGGVIGNIDRFLGEWIDPRPCKTSERLEKYINWQKSEQEQQGAQTPPKRAAEPAPAPDQASSITQKMQNVKEPMDLSFAKNEMLQSIPPRAEYQYFQVTCNALAEEFPEMHKRKRQWMTFADAKKALANRTEMISALEASSIRKS